MFILVVAGAQDVFDRVPTNQRTSVSWPEISQKPQRMRYIYAYPEEVPNLIQSNPISQNSFKT